MFFKKTMCWCWCAKAILPSWCIKECLNGIFDTVVCCGCFPW